MITEALRLMADCVWRKTVASEVAQSQEPRERFLALDGVTYLYFYNGEHPQFRRSPHWSTDGELPLYPIEET